MTDIKSKGEVARAHGVKLRNQQWSWGGYMPDGSILMFMWNHEAELRGTTMHVNALAPDDIGRNGGNDRADHVRDIDAGVPGYALLGYQKVDADGRKHWFINRQASVVPLRVVKILPPDTTGTRWAMLRDPINTRAPAPYRRSA